jgi:hypothetical protein
MSGEIRRKHREPGMTGADVIRAAVGDRCPACGSLLDIDGPFCGRPGEVVWFASCPTPGCSWLCDQDLGAIPGEWGPTEVAGEELRALERAELYRYQHPLP